MYAIVDIAGQQFKVCKDQKIFVHRLEGKEGDKVEFDKVLLYDDDKSVKVGTPTVKDQKISAKILKHCKADKVKVFKKKRRKGYQKLNGHRQYLTELLIEDLKGGGAKKATAKKTTTTTTTTKAAAPKKETKATTEKKTTAKAKTTVKKEEKPIEKKAKESTKKEEK